MIVPTISLLIASPINIFLNWLLVWGPDRFRAGFLGAPMATAISFNLMVSISVHATRFILISMTNESAVSLFHPILRVSGASGRLGRLHLVRLQESGAEYHFGHCWVLCHSQRLACLGSRWHSQRIYRCVALCFALPDLGGSADDGDAPGTANLGANSVLGTSASLLYQLPYGLTVAAAVRV